VLLRAVLAAGRTGLLAPPPGAVLRADQRLEVLAHRGGVERSCVQGTRESTTPFGEVEAREVGMQPGTPTRPAASRVDHGADAVLVPDHPQEDGPEPSPPAPHARAHRSLVGTRSTIGMPDSRSGLRQSSAIAHEPGPGGSSSASVRPPSSDRMSIRQPVSFAASRAFCPSLPIASESW
jgi:hypothetical protein